MLVGIQIMKLKKQIILFCFLLVAELPFSNLFSQNIQKPTRQSSFEAFSQGNYEKAYTEFRELLLTYSKDPLYKYYSGVCLVKMKKDPGEAVSLLQQAIQGTGSIKTLPSDGLFYLGQAQQMSGKFADATASYNSYTELVGKKTAREMGVPQFLQECFEKKGQVAVSEVKAAVVNRDSKIDSLKSEPKAVTVKPVQKTLNNPGIAKTSLPANYEKVLGEAIELQFKADSVTTILSGQKKELEKLTGDQRSNLKAKIADNEKVAAAFQSLADKKYREAQLAMHPELDTTKTLKTQTTQNKVIVDSVKKPDNQIIKGTDKHLDTPGEVVSSVSPAPMVGVFSFFDVSGKPETDPKAKITIDPEVPAGLIYRIQIAVFKNPISLTYFKGITPVYGFKIEGTDKIIYYIGMFRKSADASKALSSVKNKGFKDAFVAPLVDNKRVSSDRAASLEKEWGGKPFYSIEKTLPKTGADTITPTLIFRVDVIRTLKPLTDDVVEGMRKMAGNRGLDIQQLEDGKIDYLIGKFITFETAASYADLLKRNGYRESQVSAWLGKKEITIEAAKKLFDNLK
jgi:hypothetical protein